MIDLFADIGPASRNQGVGFRALFVMWLCAFTSVLSLSYCTQHAIAFCLKESGNKPPVVTYPPASCIHHCMMTSLLRHHVTCVHSSSVFLFVSQCHLLYFYGWTLYGCYTHTHTLLCLSSSPVSFAHMFLSVRSYLCYTPWLTWVVCVCALMRLKEFFVSLFVHAYTQGCVDLYFILRSLRVLKWTVNHWFYESNTQPNESDSLIYWLFTDSHILCHFFFWFSFLFFVIL